MELEREHVSDVVTLLSDTLRAAQQKLQDLDVERRRGLYFEKERDSLMEAHNLEKRELRTEIVQLREQLKEKLEAGARHAALQAQLQETQEQNRQLRQQVQDLTRSLEHLTKQKVRVSELQNELVMSKMAQRKDQERILELETQLEALLETNMQLTNAMKRTFLEVERVRGEQLEQTSQLVKYDHLKMHSLILLRYEVWLSLLEAIQDEAIKRHALGIDILEYKEHTIQFSFFVIRRLNNREKKEPKEVDITSRCLCSYAFWLELSACILELLFEFEPLIQLRDLYTTLWRLNSKLFLGGLGDNNSLVTAIIQEGQPLLRCLFNYFEMDLDLLLEYSPGQAIDVELSFLKTFIHKASESKTRLNPHELLKRIHSCSSYQFFINTLLNTTIESTSSNDTPLLPTELVGVSERLESPDLTSSQLETLYNVMNFQPMAINILITLQQREEQSHGVITSLSRSNEEYQHELGILSELLRHTTDQLLVLVETNRQLQLVLTRYDIDVQA